LEVAVLTEADDVVRGEMQALLVRLKRMLGSSLK